MTRNELRPRMKRLISKSSEIWGTLPKTLYRKLSVVPVYSSIVIVVSKSYQRHMSIPCRSMVVNSGTVDCWSSFR